MRRLLFTVALAVALAAALWACRKPAPVSVAPLPADETPPPGESGKPPPQDEPKPEPKPVAKDTPLAPVDVTIPAPTIAVKLVAPGTGKRDPLRYAAVIGSKQQVELAMDFYSRQAIDNASEETAVPTIVLAGTAEVTDVAKDGRATYTLTVASTDARDVKGAPPAEQFKKALKSLPGLAITGTVAANGAIGDVTMHIEKPDKMSKGALDLMKLTLPAFPLLPTEPVGSGAKWRATTTVRLRDMVNVTQTTDYELVKHDANGWTLRGTTRVTGTEQSVQGGGTISGIEGAGATDVTFSAHAFYPTFTSTVETRFRVTGDKDPKAPPDAKPETMDLMFRVGGTVKSK
jgi:hypothetical protein